MTVDGWSIQLGIINAHYGVALAEWMYRDDVGVWVVVRWLFH